MWDIKLIRDNPKEFDNSMYKRGELVRAEEVIELDARFRQYTSQLQLLQSSRNQLAKKIGLSKSDGAELLQELYNEAQKINNSITDLQSKSEEASAALHEILCTLPNGPDKDIPYGTNEGSNELIRAWGDIRDFDFIPKQHFELGEYLRQMDFESATKVSGSRFVILNDGLARLERALINFMVDNGVNNFGYREFSVPYIVNERAMFGTGQLPKFSHDSFALNHGFRLIPTAEVSLTNLVADSILAEDMLPLRMLAHSACFRSEAGSAGRDTRGMLRQHQFHKVELVSVVKPEESDLELERMTSAAEDILKKLGLPYRIMLLCSGDMGFSAKKTYDIEVWLPGQNCYREISSCSNCGDFQARRMKARYKKRDGAGNLYVHTLNGSALAVGRTMIAIMENYQTADGEILIPEALRSYINNQSKITVLSNGSL